MNRYLRSLFAAALVSAFFANNAVAAPIVTGTSYTGAPGSIASVSLTVSDDGTDDGSGVFNMNNIMTWDFRLRWDHTALGDLLPTSTMSIGGGAAVSLADLVTNTLDPAGIISNGEQGDGMGGTIDGTYYLSWFDPSFVGLDFGSGFTFNAQFEIQPGSENALPYVIDFVSDDGSFLSSLGDDSFAVPFSYADVTSGNKMMVNVPVTVTPPTPAPEPGILILLLGGVGALVAARRRR